MATDKDRKQDKLDAQNDSNAHQNSEPPQQTCAERMISALRNNDTLRGGLPFFLRLGLMRCAFIIIRSMVALHALQNYRPPRKREEGALLLSPLHGMYLRR